MASQHGLCAYCEASLDDERCQVEHVIPRSDPARGQSRELDIANMVACCFGGAEPREPADAPPGEPGRAPSRDRLSCGQIKGDRMNGDFMDPRTLPAAPSLVRVDRSGRIEVDETACRSTGQAADRMAGTVELLNLNAGRLRRERRRRWTSLLRGTAAADGRQALDTWRRSELLPGRDDRLVEFFTTARSFFAPFAERVLAEPPQGWI